MPVLTESPKPRRGEVSITSIEPPERGHRLVFDSHRSAPKGFGIKVAANGTRSFVLRYYRGGHDRRMAIGRWGGNDWTLAGARKRAGEIRREIDSGVDVLLERRREMHETTLNEAIKQFGESYCTTIKSGPKVRAALKRHVSPKLGKLRLKDVRRADVIQLVERMAEAHPRQAAHVLAYTKRMFAWAADRELIEADPVSSLKPKRISALLTPVNRARVLTDEEIKSFWESAETSGMHKLTAMALKFVLVTGQRPGEVSAMRWDEVDEDAKLWTIPASRRGKTGTAHTVPLTDTALEILADTMREVARLERRRGKGPRLIVFEARPDMALTASALSLAASRFKSELGNQDLPDLGHWRPHDLRRTMRTGLAACRIDEVVAELTVGHTRKGIAATYDRYSYMPERRAAMEAWERRLLRIVAGQPADGNVVTLAQTRRSQKRA